MSAYVSLNEGAFMKKMKTLVLASLAALVINTNAMADNNMKHIAITAIVNHPALDAVRDGTLAELKKEGYIEGKNIDVDFQSAQGNTATAAQIARKFVGDQPDVIVAIGTPSAQSVVASTRRIPVVFSAVTDPVAAKLVKSWDKSGTNVTGVSDRLPMQPQIDLIKELIPNVKTIGYIYSPGEVNSTVVLKQLQEAAKKNGLKVIDVAAPRTTDIGIAAQSLQGKVDVIYSSTDNNVVSAYEALYQSAKQAGIPLISSDTSTVERGAVAALSNNYFMIGEETGKIVGDILKGEKAGNIPVKVMDKLDVYVNLENAKTFGVKIPQSVLDKAVIVNQKAK